MVSLAGFWSKKTLLAIGLGQFVSLLITSTGFSSSELSRKGINAPTSQSFLNYVLLAIVYGSMLIHRRKALQMKWYYYLMLAIVDVEGNFLVVKAYQYTSLTSVMLLDCWTIPSVIFLTWMFLKTKYRLRKFVGVGVCVAGLVMVVFSDVHAHDRAGGSNPVKGDMLVIGGSMLYAISNVSEEFLVKSGDRIELMAMLGSFGAVISACQISILERNELQSIHWTASAMSGSTMLNLSLLTSDMWAVFIRIFAYHEKVDWMYFIAFGAVAVGLVVYSGGAKEVEENRAQIAEDSNVQSKERDEEVGLDDSVQGPIVGTKQTGDGKYCPSAPPAVSEVVPIDDNKNAEKHA
ncbi:uncharacterized protein LOC131246337 isoform X4 [Magnolia sinica]|uniref:uncharacterized protein LOC131246337 isoform X4 n=1 Tax=Magnolia sinica TaxID=86752 RepID=UPI00265901D8|nr:uncharacterized protein LOC131246337 isoform X4 [Magnolia sinica]